MSVLAATLCATLLVGCSATTREAQITGYERTGETSIRVWIERDEQDSIAQTEAKEDATTIVVAVRLEGPEDGAWIAVEDSVVIELKDPVGDRDVVNSAGDSVPLR
ncbi:hypothetical protein [uncultured Microbacterium sp.]|nr:hypothetical protein [uncultured Microbacterium sp.]